MMAEVLNVKILKIMTKLCIRSDDTKKDCLLTPFSIVKQLSISKILVLSSFIAGFNTSADIPKLEKKCWPT
jgi:hypothetical protein